MEWHGWRTCVWGKLILLFYIFVILVLSFFHRLSGAGHRGSSLKREAQTSLLPATANRSRGGVRTGLMEPTGPHHLQIAEILRSSNQTCSTPWLHRKIMSLKVINRICDKGQAWRSPALTRNGLDFLPALRTRV